MNIMPRKKSTPRKSAAPLTPELLAEIVEWSQLLKASRDVAYSPEFMAFCIKNSATIYDPANDAVINAAINL